MTEIREWVGGHLTVPVPFKHKRQVFGPEVHPVPVGRDVIGAASRNSLSATLPSSLAHGTYTCYACSRVPCRLASRIFLNASVGG